jgi:hypothetical protein
MGGGDLPQSHQDRIDAEACGEDTERRFAAFEKLGKDPLSRCNAAWMAATRRRTQRSTPGNSISRRKSPHATSRLLACSTPPTSASSSAKVSGRRAARQSGNRLNVR